MRDGQLARVRGGMCTSIICTAQNFVSTLRVLIAAATVALAAMPSVMHGASITYEHDVQGRLKKATYDNGAVINYSYDANGNRTGTTVTAAPPDTTPPSAPGTPTFSSISMSSATASWTAATDNVGVSGYDYRLNSGSWQSMGNVLSTSLTGLSAATAYTVQVRARDAATNLGPASSSSFTTPDTVAPTQPTGLGASAPSSTTVNLSWTASTDNVAVTGYKVFRNSGQIGTSGTTSYADNTVSGSTAYSYTVSAYDAAGNNSAQSSAANVTTPDTIAPTTPSGLSATAVSATQVNLSWTGSSDSGGSGLAGYRVYRGGSQIGTSATVSYSDTTVAAGTSYSYNVRAYDNASNTSGNSNTASVTTPVPLQTSVSSTTWSWFYQTGWPAPQISPNVVVSASGGTGTGYTYLWQRVSGDTVTSVTAATSASTAWSRSVPNFFVDYTSVWRCRVTDSASNVTYTPNVTVNFRKEDFSLRGGEDR